MLRCRYNTHRRRLVVPVAKNRITAKCTDDAQVSAISASQATSGLQVASDSDMAIDRAANYGEGLLPTVSSYTTLVGDKSTWRYRTIPLMSSNPSHCATSFSE